jgi:hypothetical protein
MPALSIALSLAIITALPARPAVRSAHPLTFDERVAAQEAIERVYYAHQVGGSEPFETAVPRVSLERQVRTTLEQSLLLERFWKTPITAEALRREAGRIASETRAPDRLRELYAALHDDPFLIQECLARQTLAGRLARNFFATDQRIHAAARADAKSLRTRLIAGAGETPAAHRVVPVHLEVEIGAPDRDGPAAGRPVRVDADTFRALRSGLPAHAGEVGAVREETDAFVVVRMIASSPDRARFDRYAVPKKTWEEWLAVQPALDVEDVQAVADGAAMPLADPSPAVSHCRPADSWAPKSRDEEPTPRFLHTALWTGSEMLVWGGFGPDGLFQRNGGRYDPLTDTWSPISLVNAPGPTVVSPYVHHTAVWSGSEMIAALGTTSGTSGRYNPITDTWRTVSQAGAPPGDFNGVWIGTGMLAPGALYNPFSDTWTAAHTPFNFGGWPGAIWTDRDVLVLSGQWNTAMSFTRYDPVANTSVSLAGPPIVPRGSFTAVWTGSGLIVWGGLGAANGGSTPVAVDSGAVYDPVRNTWTTMSTTGAPSARSLHSAVWTGSRMIVWGGNSGNQQLNTGASYDPASDTWRPTATANTPLARDSHTAIWTSSLMIVWGGTVTTGQVNNGGRYDPFADAWTPTTGVVPLPRYNHTAVWTGTQMVVWGGRVTQLASVQVPVNTGAKYDPILEDWSPTTMLNSPAARSEHVAVWTGSRMIVWGGQGVAPGNFLGDGARWDPVADSWTSVSTLNAPSPRSLASAVWTGTRMIVWSGLSGGQAMSGGALYNASSDNWTTMANNGSASIYSVVVWTGTQMAVWGGSTGLGGTMLNTGALYRPAGNTWTSMSILNAPDAVFRPNGVFTGTEILIWPGRFDHPVARYDVASNSWSYGTAVGAPGTAGTGGYYSSVWSGSEMLLWGDAPGYRYNPALNLWSPMSTLGEPIRRHFHTALWTASDMLIWGGEKVSALLNDSARYAPEQVDADLDSDGFTACDGDCDDSNPAVHPGAAEVCNGIDDDCDGIRDNGFPDADGDGWAACGGDCNDANAAVHPGAAEQCNGLDDNCDGRIDEGFDFDGDGFTQCGGDCNDTDPAVHPGAVELCNHLDDDCDGAVDEGFPDSDGDGYAACAGDCNDANAAIHPGAAEQCNGLDDNCDGVIDENPFALCDDTNPCTSDVCGGAPGCTHVAVANGTRCVFPNYPSYCFQNAACFSGACLSGAPLDQDGDGHGDPNCGGDDCNDVDAGAWHVPLEVMNLTLSASSPIALAWDSQAASTGPGTTYDVAAGSVATSGQFVDLSGCLGSSGTATTYQDPLFEPPVDQFYWYLVRARNSCAVGTYGSGSDGAPRPITDCP